MQGQNSIVAQPNPQTHDAFDIIRAFDEDKDLEEDGELTQDYKDKLEDSMARYKKQWDGEERNTYGATPLHFAILQLKDNEEKDPDGSNAPARTQEWKPHTSTALVKYLWQKAVDLRDKVYTGKEYTGENCIHMAIVKGDRELIQFLLQEELLDDLAKSLDAATAALEAAVPGQQGKLSEQKTKVVEQQKKLLKQQKTLLAQPAAGPFKSLGEFKVSCEGKECPCCRYGQHPLCWAACRLDEEILNSLLSIIEKGGWMYDALRCRTRPVPKDKTEKGGWMWMYDALRCRTRPVPHRPEDMTKEHDTILHMLVRQSGLEGMDRPGKQKRLRIVFDTIWSKVEISCRGREKGIRCECIRCEPNNADGWTPLMLCAVHGSKDMFEFLLNKYCVSVRWTFGPHSGSRVEICKSRLDHDFEAEEDSVLSLLVRHKKVDLVDTFFMDKLLEEKWKCYAQYEFYQRLTNTVVLLLCLLDFSLAPEMSSTVAETVVDKCEKYIPSILKVLTVIICLYMKMFWETKKRWIIPCLFGGFLLPELGKLFTHIFTDSRAAIDTLLVFIRFVIFPILGSAFFNVGRIIRTVFDVFRSLWAGSYIHRWLSLIGILSFGACFFWASTWQWNAKQYITKVTLVLVSSRFFYGEVSRRVPRLLRRVPIVERVYDKVSRLVSRNMYDFCLCWVIVMIVAAFVVGLVHLANLPGTDKNGSETRKNTTLIQSLYFLVLPAIILFSEKNVQPFESLSSIFLFPCCVGLVWDPQLDLKDTPNYIEFRPLELGLISSFGFLRLFAYMGGFESLGILVALLKRPLKNLRDVIILGAILSTGFSYVLSVLEHSSSITDSDSSKKYIHSKTSLDAFEGLLVEGEWTRTSIWGYFVNYLGSNVLSFVGQADYKMINHSHPLVFIMCSLLTFGVQFVVPMILLQFIQQQATADPSAALWKLDRATLIETIDSELPKDIFRAPNGGGGIPVFTGKKIRGMARGISTKFSKKRSPRNGPLKPASEDTVTSV